MKDIATSTTTTYILEKYKLHVKKKFGQNFLIDSNIVEKIAIAGDIDKETCVIEIGPGIGALTQVLARHAKKVHCFEIDTDFKPVHEEFFCNSNVEITYQDFLEIDIEKFINELNNTYQRICVVANLPYYITTKLLEKMVLSDTKIDTIVVMIQKEVAKKLSSEYSSPLTNIIEYRGNINYQFTVSQNVFIPAPRVDSAVIRINIDKPYDEKLYEIMEVCFKQKRKTIYNNLKKEYMNAREILEIAGIAENKRSEELTIEDFIKIKEASIK